MRRTSIYIRHVLEVLTGTVRQEEEMNLTRVGKGKQNPSSFTAFVTGTQKAPEDRGELGG